MFIDLLFLRLGQSYLHAELQVSGCLVDLLFLTLSGLSQLIGSFQKLLGISVSVLTHTHRKTGLTSGFSSGCQMNNPPFPD